MIVRRAAASDTPHILALLRASYGGWLGEASEAYWNWKFERNPHGPARIWVGEEDGRIAGCYIWNPVRMHTGSGAILGAQSVDAAVHPDYQGRSVFTRLARAAVEQTPATELQLVYAFPTEGAWRGQLRAGFVGQFAVPMTHRPLTAPVFAARAARELELAPVQAFDESFAVFGNGARADELRVLRDPGYLQWRYLEHSSHTYEVTQCRRDGDVLGYSVLRTEGRRGWVVDLQVRPHARAAARCLAHHAVHRLRAAGCRVAGSFRRPGGLEDEALRACGFSSRYARLNRRLRRRQAYVTQIVAYAPAAIVQGSAPSRRMCWSLVPGDADYL